MRRLTIALVLGLAVSAVSASTALADGPTCADTLSIDNHGQHVIRDYVMGEADNAKGGAIMPGGPAAGGHFLADPPVAPGASFCTDSNSPGVHP